jgi:hypothetical protein
MAERNERGQYIKGVSGNPAGRPTRQTENKYLQITIGSVSEDDWKAIIDKAVVQAKAGDKNAREWLSDYLQGKPIENLNIFESDTEIIWPD